MRPSLWITFVAASLLCGSVQAEIYKWKDEKGVVHYSNSVPPNRSARPIDTSGSRISVYKPVKPTEAQLADLQDYLRYRQQLSLVEAGTPSFGPASIPDPYPGWYAQCEREMFADCDDPRALSSRYGGAYPWNVYPQVVVGSRLAPPRYPVPVVPGRAFPTRAGAAKTRHS